MCSFNPQMPGINWAGTSQHRRKLIVNTSLAENKIQSVFAMSVRDSVMYELY